MMNLNFKPVKIAAIIIGILLILGTAGWIAITIMMKNSHF